MAPTLSLNTGFRGFTKNYAQGRLRSISDEKVAALICKTLKTKPKDGTYYTIRSMSNGTKLSRPTLHRIWKTFGHQPHRQCHSKLSTAPCFLEELRDIVGLYLNHSDKAMVLCVDEQSQIQALNPTRPLLPSGWLGYVEGETHYRIRHGAATLFAALTIATGQVLPCCKRRHHREEYLQFLRHVDTNVPPDLNTHLVVDNYAAHKHPNGKSWPAAHPRYQVHYKPTYAFWLNQVEICFNHVTQRVIRRRTFRSVKNLTSQSDQFMQNYNADGRPFACTAKADSILEKIKRVCQCIYET